MGADEAAELQNDLRVRPERDPPHVTSPGATPDVRADGALRRRSEADETCAAEGLPPDREKVAHGEAPPGGHLDYPGRRACTDRVCAAASHADPGRNDDDSAPGEDLDVYAKACPVASAAK